MQHLEPGFCIVCGYFNQNWQYKPIISDELAESWQLTKLQRQQFDIRESSFCSKCGNSLRSRSLAKVIIDQIQFPKVRTFIDWIKLANQNKLKVAEINSCGKLHLYLRKIKRLYYSEFNLDRDRLSFWHKLVSPPHEDIVNLNYKDAQFDLVLHSEVLEHVPDYHQALFECRRILKPIGICLFTIPLIPKRKTRQCVSQNPKTKELIYHKSPSFHGSGSKNDYLVWWEFGGDLIKIKKLRLVYKNNHTLNYVFKLNK